MDFENFQTNYEHENAGVWVQIGKDAHIKVARASDANEAYTSALRAKYKDHRYDLEQGDESSHELENQILIELYADHILKGLRGMRKGGEEIVYTPQVGRELLKNKDFFARVRQHATNFEHFKQKAEDDAVKN